VTFSVITLSLYYDLTGLGAFNLTLVVFNLYIDGFYTSHLTLTKFHVYEGGKGSCSAIGTRLLISDWYVAIVISCAIKLGKSRTTQQKL
jgi:hypothetical protein